MKKKTKSILEELTHLGNQFDKAYIIESSARNSIASAANLVKLIHEHYSESEAADLEKRLFNSIRTGDERKFIRGLRKINEGKKPGHTVPNKI